MRSLPILATLFLLAGPAHATIIETFTDRDAFLLQAPAANAATVTFGPSGPGPFINLVGLATTADAGLLSVSAPPSGVFGNGAVVSTAEERADLVLTFTQPLRAVGLFGFVTDDAFGAISGTLLLDIGGGATTQLSNTAAGPVFRGFRSDVDFTTLTISVLSFDTNASSVAFVGLTDTFYAGIAPVAVPAPGLAALFAPALALAFLRLRRSGARNACPPRSSSRCCTGR